MDYSITNHIQYKEHMKNFVSIKKCQSLLMAADQKTKALHAVQLAKVQLSLKEHRAEVEKLRVENERLRDQLKLLIKKCVPPKPKCPITPLDQHPQYIELKRIEAEKQLHNERLKAEQSKLDSDKCPEVINAKRKLDELRQRCMSGSSRIEDHPDYQSLMERHRREIALAQSQVESETKRKTRSDIRDHPDYRYIKGYYESEIARLKAQIRSECPEFKTPAYL